MAADPAALVLYDADCGLCTALARWLAAQGVAVAPIGSPAGVLHLRDLRPERRNASVHAVDRVGRRYSGADALPAVMRAVPALRWAAGAVEAAPRPFAIGYALVARNRRFLSRLLRVRPASRGRAD